MGKFSILALAATASFLAGGSPTFAAELVTNGSFTAGDTGFDSTFTHDASGDGLYRIVTDPSSLCGCFVSYGDHTTGTGNMLFADPNEGATGAFWTESFNVAANSAYSVSFWAAQAGGGPQAQVEARINGVSLGSVTPGGAGVWEQFAALYNSGAATNVTLSLFDLNTSHSYNDFTVDDISFTGPSAVDAVPEPATWAMMLIGFGAIGTARRRALKPTVSLA